MSKPWEFVCSCGEGFEDSNVKELCLNLLQAEHVINWYANEANYHGEEHHLGKTDKDALDTSDISIDMGAAARNYLKNSTDLWARDS